MPAHFVNYQDGFVGFLVVNCQLAVMMSQVAVKQFVGDDEHHQIGVADRLVRSGVMVGPQRGVNAGSIDDGNAFPFVTMSFLGGYAGAGSDVVPSGKGFQKS